MDARSIETGEVIWSGIKVRVTFERNWLNSNTFPRAHLQVESINPKRAPLPITETGYRSHFLAAQDVDAAGGFVAYALAWLQHEAATPAWSAGRQLDLFI